MNVIIKNIIQIVLIILAGLVLAGCDEYSSYAKTTKEPADSTLQEHKLNAPEPTKKNYPIDKPPQASVPFPRVPEEKPVTKEGASYE